MRVLDEDGEDFSFMASELGIPRDGLYGNLLPRDPVLGHINAAEAAVANYMLCGLIGSLELLHYIYKLLIYSINSARNNF